MEEEFIQYINYIEDPFLSRGCCRPPQMDDQQIFSCDLQCAKLGSWDWLKDIPLSPVDHALPFIEVRFKNSRKEYFQGPEHQSYQPGEIVAVEGSPGHDIGIVSLSGVLAQVQMRRKGIRPEGEGIRKIYRRARNTDIEKWSQAISREEPAKILTRQIASELGLQMKVNDVEFQGDNTKAIFYYTADERVDFRLLIKRLAEEFHVRVEMRQIGVRQEASRLGGIGSCGRELCCSTWLSDFKSVTTQSARLQQLSLNPQKLAGQCGKLKCCLNYEVEVYKDAVRDLPNTEIVLKTKKGEAVFQKADVFKLLVWYAYTSDESNFMAIPVDKVREIIEMNRRKEIPDKLEDFAFKQEKKSEFDTVLEEDDLTRFDD